MHSSQIREVCTCIRDITMFPGTNLPWCVNWCAILGVDCGTAGVCVRSRLVTTTHAAPAEDFSHVTNCERVRMEKKDCHTLLHLSRLGSPKVLSQVTSGPK